LDSLGSTYKDALIGLLATDHSSLLDIVHLRSNVARELAKDEFLQDNARFEQDLGLGSWMAILKVALYCAYISIFIELIGQVDIIDSWLRSHNQVWSRIRGLYFLMLLLAGSMIATWLKARYETNPDYRAIVNRRFTYRHESSSNPIGSMMSNIGFWRGVGYSFYEMMMLFFLITVLFAAWIGRSLDQKITDFGWMWMVLGILFLVLTICCGNRVIRRLLTCFPNSWRPRVRSVINFLRGVHTGERLRYPNNSGLHEDCLPLIMDAVPSYGTV
jgi:hypothetical protein